MAERILLTGATGNVGQSVLKYFQPSAHQSLFIASRQSSGLQSNELYFDFETPGSYTETLCRIDVLFLLRPPHISNVEEYFIPLIDAAKQAGLKHIIFLSVQGADKVSYIPHAKIEKLIVKSGIPFTFIRPSYFMQNLTTTLADDICRYSRIVLPSGKARFLWVDVDDIGRAIAAVLVAPAKHKNKAYTITGKELADFRHIAEMLSKSLGRKISFENRNPLSFYFYKRRTGMQIPFILVIILLHFLPRFQKAPEISHDFTLLTGHQPNTLQKFIDAHISVWVNNTNKKQ